MLQRAALKKNREGVFVSRLTSFVRAFCTLAGCLLSTGAWAYLTNPGTCTTDSVSITQMETSPLDGTGVIFQAPPNVYSTSCFGVVDGNDHQHGLSAPDPNIGQFNDGLLNGQGNIVSPLQFISSSQLQDLDGDGNFTDPGWIFLGSVDSEAGTQVTMDGYDKPLNIDDVLAFNLSCSGAADDPCTEGTWQLTTTLDIIEKVTPILGLNSFDHLAFVIKASNSYAIYDFDFNEILQMLLAAGGSGFNFHTPYSLTGTWDTRDFFNNKGKAHAYSHISLWVRDPSDITQVPLPGTLALLSLGLLLLGLSRKRQ